MSFRVPNQHRLREGRMGSEDSIGNNGCFLIPNPLNPKDGELRIIASDGKGWEHVSVSLALRCPTWEEMCWVKGTFWGAEDYVVQYHPPESQYVNCHPNCLHLWKPSKKRFPMPPSWMVG